MAYAPIVFDENEVRKALQIFHGDGGLFEIRILGSGKSTTSGVFRDAETAIEALKVCRADEKNNVYMTLNRLKDGCDGWAQSGQFVDRADTTASDNDIEYYRWLMIDIDPKRVKNTSSTKEELQGSRLLAKRILDYLTERGWPLPVIAHSGNGTHIMYRIDIPNDKDGKGKGLMQNALKALNMLFADDEQEVDMTTFNPARICKLYGTVAKKGANKKDRPHRLSKVLRVPDKIEFVDTRYIEELVSVLPKAEEPQKYNRNRPEEFDLQRWVDEHKVPVAAKRTWSGGVKYILEHCPFNPDHKNKDAALIQTSDGKICFNCFHASCADKHWKEFRLYYEPDAYQKATPNYILAKKNKPTGFISPLEDKENAEESKEPVWRTTEDIRNREAPAEAHIETGIKALDSKMVGLKKGYVTVLSGLRSAGKSSILSQIVVQCRQQGMKCALFSGEMNDKSVLKWLTLQAAGRTHVHGTQYPNLFYPNDDAAVAVSKWLNEFVYIYNNDYGNNFVELEQRLIEVITQKQLDMVLIDNLMALNVEDLDRDLYVRQTKFVKELKKMANQLNVHVLFVAHPRKSMGYLRMDDISGSGDLSNAADNVLIIHRVDEDFKKATQQFFGWKKDNALYEAGNVLEVCKDRDFGTRDTYIPLYFEIETKRLKNDRDEYIHYGWEEGFVPEAKYGTVVEDQELPF